MSSNLPNKTSPTLTPSPSTEQSTEVSVKTLIKLIRDLKNSVSVSKPIIKEDGTTKGQKGSGGDSGHGKSDPTTQIEKLEINLEQIITSLEELSVYEKDFEEKIKAHRDRINDLFENIKKSRDSKADEPPASKADEISAAETTIGKKLWEINKEIKKLKHRIPSSSKLTGASADHQDDSKKTEETGTEVEVEVLLRLHVSKTFAGSSFCNEIETTFKGLGEEEKACLLCFSVFDENEELSRRMLTYWWEGEGFLKPEKEQRGDTTIEEIAGKILNTFVEKCLIEPVYKKKQPITKSYRMQPVVRSVIVQSAADKNFISYDYGGNLEGKSPERAWLVKYKPKKDSSSSNSKGQENTKAPTSPGSEQQSARTQSDAKDSSSSNSKGKGIISRCFGAQESTRRQSGAKDKDQESTRRQSGAKDKDEEQTRKQSGAKDKDLKPALTQSDTKDKDQDTYKLKTIFNVDEPFPDLRLKWLAKENGKDKAKSLEADEWLAKMKDLKVLYLGTWRSSGKHHIEVDSTDFLKGLKSTSSLRLLSLQGISRINELKDSIKGLLDLRILDLKACHNLEELPKEISYLKNLTHLDVSDCYMMAHMPKGLSYLTNLQVLKGFVVGDYKNKGGKFSNLEDLAGMKKLRKLSIVISNNNFPTANDLSTFEKLQEVKKLTLSWGADPSSGTSSSPTTQKAAKKPVENLNAATKPFEHLEKLDLQCYPQDNTPTWLRVENFSALKKLYIRGGKLRGDLGYSSSSPNGNNGGVIKWVFVETLRLKYLAGLKMNWDEMQELFPKLSYLEKVDCPLITMCPCDEDGVWCNKQSDQVKKPDDHQKAIKQAEESDLKKPQQSG